VKIIIVEKDLAFSQRLERIVTDMGHTVTKKVISYSNASAIISKIIPDCVICASMLNEKYTGFELASSLSQLRIPFVFTDLTPSDANYSRSLCYPLSYYLPKPFEALTLKSILDNFNNNGYEYYSSHIHKGKYIFIKKNNVFEKIALHDITRLRSEGNYTIIYLGKKKFVIKFSLSKLLELPHFNSFFRIHRNYAVQKNKIIKVDFSERICETKDEKIPFGRTYAKRIRQIMNLPYNLL